MIFSHWPQSAIFFEILFWIFLVASVILVWRGGLSLKILGIIFICGAIWAGFVEPSILIIREELVENKQLKGLKIALVSDLHVGPYRSARSIRKIVDKINGLKVDIVAVPGDFLHGKAIDFATELKPLSELKAPYYLTIGNHDHVSDSGPVGVDVLRKRLAEYGGIELRNSSLHLRDNLWVAGVDDNYLGYDDLDKAFSGIPEGSEIILLAHSPDIIRNKQSQRAALILSGHTHGGQIRMPWGSIPFVIPAKETHYDRGYFPDKNIVVTSGAGEVATRARFLNPPEIRIISFY